MLFNHITTFSPMLDYQHRFWDGEMWRLSFGPHPRNGTVAVPSGFDHSTTDAKPPPAPEVYTNLWRSAWVADARNGRPEEERVQAKNYIKNFWQQRS